MQMIHYKYTNTELDKILSSLTIIMDTREKRSEHIVQYFKDKKIPFVIKTLKTGDYSAMIGKNEELGITRDIYLSACLERKNSVDEIIGNFSKDKRTSFENEMIRASKHPFVLVIEDGRAYERILTGDYRSQYDPKALLGSLKTFEARYNFSTVFLDPKFTGNYIYHHFLYMAKEHLKNGVI